MKAIAHLKMHCLQFLKYTLGQMSDVHVRRVEPYVVKVKVNDKGVQFEIDTGCSLTVMNEQMFKKVWKETKRHRRPCQSYRSCISQS